MNNRWGRQLEPKGSLRSSGQNNINININFNAMKDKPNVFGGKKIDNFIQISNEPKPNVSRPNVSMETLKQKKKKQINKQDFVIQQELQRKKSKSKLNNDLLTPQKKNKQRHLGNSKSIGRKSTKKRSTKSFDNLKKFYGRNSPRDLQRYQQKQTSNEIQKESKTNSKSKSKSRQKSNKKLIKNGSKTKITTNATNTRAKNSSHNSKKQQEQAQQMQMPKSRKQSTKKLENKQSMAEKLPEKGAKNEDNIQIQSQFTLITKKTTSQRASRKKYSQDQIKKTGQNQRTKTPKKNSNQKQKGSKSLKRLPLYYEQEQQFDEEGTYTKIQKQAYNLLYDNQKKNQVQKSNSQSNKKGKRSNSQKDTQHEKNIQVGPFGRYLQKKFTAKDLHILFESAIKIQKIWRGYKVRTQFLNNLNLMSHKIQITRNKIANKDPKFWDDGRSNSILRGEDEDQKNSSDVISQLNSNIEKPIKSQHENSQDFQQSVSSKSNKMKKNRIIQIQAQQNYSEQEKPKNKQKKSQKQLQEMMQKINKLQQNLRKQQQKALKLQQQNRQLKQRVSVNSFSNSNTNSNNRNKQMHFNHLNNKGVNGIQSMDSSLKSNQSWEQVRIRYQDDPFLEEDRKKQKQTDKHKEKKHEQQQFQLRLPKRITNPNANIQSGTQKQKQKQFHIRQKQHIKKNQKNQDEVNYKEQIIQQLSQSRNLSQQSEESLSNSNIITTLNPNARAASVTATNNIKKYKARIQAYQCSSPKYIMNNTSGLSSASNGSAGKVTINASLLQLFQRKEQQLKEKFEKKVTLYDRMFSDKIFSPRTYSFKKNQLQERFRVEAQIIRNRKQQAARVVEYIKQIQKQEPKQQLSSNGSGDMRNKTNEKQSRNRPEIIKQKNHIIQDYGNVNLNSHRSKSQASASSDHQNYKDRQLRNNERSESQSNNEDYQQQFQSSLESNKSSKSNIVNNNSNASNNSNTSIFKKSGHGQHSRSQDGDGHGSLNAGTSTNININITKQIQQKNNQAIRIFNQVSKQSNSQQQQLQQSQQLSQSQQSQSQPLSQPPQLQPSLAQSQQPKPPRGFQTTLHFIRQYCISLIEFIQNSQNHKDGFIEAICTPIQFNELQLLKTYRTDQRNQHEGSYNSNEYEYIYPYFRHLAFKNGVISRESFNEFNNMYEKVIIQCPYPGQRSCFLNSLLDGLNQSLDFKRPCSVYGKPPAWDFHSRGLKNLSLQNISDTQLPAFPLSQKFDQICGSAIAKVVEWATTLCGFIPESPQIENVVIEQEQINQIRETRIALMLERDLLQNEEQMLDQTGEIVQVQLWVAQGIVNIIFQQLVKDIEVIQRNR